MLYVKLVPYVEEIIGKYLGGFQRVRSTVDHIFTMRHIVKMLGKEYICTLFIDFQAAYNTLEKGNME
jgi:hypothetical protein